jgi:ABC-2 type transport system ATP-binding protein
VSERTAIAIETRKLSKRYEETLAVDRLDLRIQRGEVFGLLGPNGAGKTTTILMLLGLTEPTDGMALVDGLVPQQEALAVKRRIGYLPDDVGFYDDLTGRQNLRYTARLNRLPAVLAEERIAANLDEVGLTDVADRKVKGYSRGMRQRLGLADALVKDPSILILDEPTVNIDPEGVREILALVRRLSDERSVTVLLSSHLLHQVEQVCDRIGIFLRGRLVALGTMEKLAAALEDRWAVEVGVAGGVTSDLVTVLERVPGVNGVERDGELAVLAADHDVRPAVVDALLDAGHPPVHLRRRGADLDAIYHRYFTGADGDGA